MLVEEKSNLVNIFLYKIKIYLIPCQVNHMPKRDEIGFYILLGGFVLSVSSYVFSFILGNIQIFVLWMEF